MIYCNIISYDDQEKVNRKNKNLLFTISHNGFSIGEVPELFSAKMRTKVSLAENNEGIWAKRSVAAYRVLSAAATERKRGKRQEG